ncbi:MAG TPA: AMP-binding protein [Ktedonobacteraceae bacterium]|jgi:acyl-CoA synthetase (AMP-forming)/AMP-acid ligase II|nr:AMP-binding protein [Ktedonobacteraceae bacterium]
MTTSNRPAEATSQQTPTPAPAPHYLDAHAQVRPNKMALICGERALTYAELNARARGVANALGGLGVKANDRVAVMSHNSIELLEIACGLSKLSAIGVMLNYRLREHEVAYILKDCQAKVAIAGPGMVEVVDTARAEVASEVVYITVGKEFRPGWRRYEELLAGAGEDVPGGEGGLGSTMSYTSGTTGKPKGAYRAHGVPAADIIRLIQAFELGEPDVHLLAGPYYHSAPSFFVSLHLLLGSTIVIQPRYDPVDALQLIERHEVTTTFMAPTLLQRLCDVPEEIFSRYHVRSLRSIILAGAPCPYALKVRATERFGPILWEFYGATETGVVTLLRPEDQLRKPGSCGKAGPGQEIRLLDAEGHEVPVGVPGEMWTRNSWLAEYYNKPDATAGNMRDGFFSVGDIAYCDEEGYYYICDRKIDMIISGGVNIYPAEVEAALSAHPAVADVAVIGVPNAQWGESVKAVVQLKAGATASAEELIAFCSELLADYKRPRSIDFVDELPRNPAGKLLKNQIREPYWRDAGRRI